MCTLSLFQNPYSFIYSFIHLLTYLLISLLSTIKIEVVHLHSIGINYSRIVYSCDQIVCWNDYLTIRQDVSHTSFCKLRTNPDILCTNFQLTHNNKDTFLTRYQFNDGCNTAAASHAGIYIIKIYHNLSQRRLPHSISLTGRASYAFCIPFVVFFLSFPSIFLFCLPVPQQLPCVCHRVSGAL